SLLRVSFLKNQTLNGDFNGDHAVTAADLDIWRLTFGQTTDLRADGNGNGVIDAGDYVVWRKHAAAGAGASASTGVPEPTGVVFVVLGCFLMGSRRYRRDCR